MFENERKEKKKERRITAKICSAVIEFIGDAAFSHCLFNLRLLPVEFVDDVDCRGEDDDDDDDVCTIKRCISSFQTLAPLFVFYLFKCPQAKKSALQRRVLQIICKPSERV